MTAQSTDTVSTNVAENKELNSTYEEYKNDRPHVSRKRLKRLTRLTVEELKQLVDIPEVVEPWDVAAIDPKLLVSLKSYRNTIPVPRHWCQRMPYLQRRKERRQWELPGKSLVLLYYKPVSINGGYQRNEAHHEKKIYLRLYKTNRHCRNS